jgi:hypothetical protein
MENEGAECFTSALLDWRIDEARETLNGGINHLRLALQQKLRQIPKELQLQ